jgi:hypothetical protein
MSTELKDVVDELSEAELVSDLFDLGTAAVRITDVWGIELVDEGPWFRKRYLISVYYNAVSYMTQKGKPISVQFVATFYSKAQRERAYKNLVEAVRTRDHVQAAVSRLKSMTYQDREYAMPQGMSQGLLVNSTGSRRP